MLDTLIRGGTVVDGTGCEPYTADLGIRDGKIVAVGRLSEAARRTYDADGAHVMPGFIDIHTHYDGQASWDETFTPSIYHGVTTQVMGNCGVGGSNWPLFSERPSDPERLAPTYSHTHSTACLMHV